MLPHGNYNIVSLCAKLQELLNNPASWTPLPLSETTVSPVPNVTISVSVGEAGVGSIDPRVVISSSSTYN